MGIPSFFGMIVGLVIVVLKIYFHPFFLSLPSLGIMSLTLVITKIVAGCGNSIGLGTSVMLNFKSI